MNREAARKILNRVRSAYVADYTYRVVEPAAFPHLSLRFYEEVQRRLQALGFRQVADVENETIKRQTPDPRTFIRIMTAADGLVNAAIYHICPTLRWRLMMFMSGMRTTKVVEFQSELENSYQVVTTTVRRQDMLPTSPKLYRNYQSDSTPLETLYQSHRTILERVAKEVGVKPLAHATLDDILGFQNRQMAIQRHYLESLGWVTKEYLMRQAGGNAALIEPIHAEIQKILEEERRLA